jgi:hypothetical protein
MQSAQIHRTEASATCNHVNHCITEIKHRIYAWLEVEFDIIWPPSLSCGLSFMRPIIRALPLSLPPSFHAAFLSCGLSIRSCGLSILSCGLFLLHSHVAFAPLLCGLSLPPSHAALQLPFIWPLPPSLLLLPPCSLTLTPSYVAFEPIPPSIFY